MNIRSEQMKRFAMFAGLTLVLGGTAVGALGTRGGGLVERKVEPQRTIASDGGAPALQTSAPKVTICHFPPGNPANFQVIVVGGPAALTHVSQHNDAVCSEADRDCCYGGSSPSVCTSFQTDEANCGACGHACPAGQTCTSGTCQCPPGQTLCAGTCVDTNSDPNNCGACGTVCPSGATCTGGACSSLCGNGVLDPGEACDPPGSTCGTSGICSPDCSCQGPNPECTGAMCGTFTPCNPGSACSAPVCATTAEGGGVCLEGSTGCAGLADCTTSADCPGGTCAVNSCCGRPVCVPSTAFCPAP